LRRLELEPALLSPAKLTALVRLGSIRFQKVLALAKGSLPPVPTHGDGTEQQAPG